MIWVSFTGPNGEAIFVGKDQVAGMTDQTVDPSLPRTNVLLKGGGWLTVQGRPADVKAALEAA